MTYLPTLNDRIREITEGDQLEAERIAQILRREHDLGALDDADFAQAVRLAQLSLDEDSEQVTLEQLAELAHKVMEDLEQYGPSIVPHLLDTDDNDGQRLREAIAVVRSRTGKEAPAWSVASRSA